METTKTPAGRHLADARRNRNVSLQQAAKDTGTPAGLLEAFEGSQLNGSAVPEYAQEALERYAGYLGIGSERAPAERGIVEAVGVRRSYRTEEITVNALDRVTLSIGKGELVAVMGPSGCGKTTLLNTLSGLDSIDEGEIFIAGEPLHAMSDARRTDYRAHFMGFIFQSFNLMPVLSAVENVELPLLVGGTGVKKARDRALEVLEGVRLADRAHHRPNQLSGGQQQRVAIARALVNQPAIVWADEPTGNLDSDTSREVLDLILDLNKNNGQTFVIVTHDPGVGALANRIIKMRDGKILDASIDSAPSS
ncbi:MAG: ATP-binding cassette domain-containing protein [Rubrobacter sp.]|nr:ATP-binding cassette domain-containing protein [Rubrobacter sp.]